MPKLPVKIGLAAAAVLLCLAEGGATALENILSGNRLTLRQKLRRMENLGTISECYDALLGLRVNSLRMVLWRLRKRGLIKKSGRDHVLSFLGRKIANKINRESTFKWDGRWRLIMFDIPETKRALRLWLNSKLINYDYHQLQKSVLIGKKPLDEDFFKELIDKDLYQYVRIITIGEIDDDKYLPH